MAKLAKIDFWQFCLFVDKKFFKKRENVLKPIAKELQDMIDSDLEIIFLSLPPRTGKSYIVTLFAAWVLGLYPEESIMRNTYASTLAEKFSNDIKKIIKSEGYQEVFGYIKFTRDKVNNWELEKSRHGVSYFCAGVGGAITGFGASKFAILDDSIKNAEEALSEGVLEKKWDWYTSTHMSRMEKGCKEIHIATRWSKRDIIGRLLEDEENLSQRKYKVINVPALVDDGHGNEISFCEEVKSTREYLYLKSITDELIWEAEFMQNPVEAKGRLYIREDMKWFEMKNIEKTIPDAVISVGDIADEGSDSLCVPIGYVFGDEVYIVDVVFTREAIELSSPEVVGKLIEHKVDSIQFESNNGGKGYALEIKRQLKAEGARTTVTWKPTVQNKHTRIIMNSGQIKERFRFRKDVRVGSEYDRYIKEILKYNKNGKAKHDDALDGTTMLNEFIQQDSEIQVW